CSGRTSRGVPPPQPRSARARDRPPSRPRPVRPGARTSGSPGRPSALAVLRPASLGYHLRRFGLENLLRGDEFLLRLLAHGRELRIALVDHAADPPVTP